jgi:uncharacterized protein with FMN-binding domain
MRRILWTVMSTTTAAQINGFALPVLNQEVLQLQSACIDTVSGATVTSDGYLPWLQSAIEVAQL